MKKLIVVSGYFNPIHGGHIKMLEAAKDYGDKVLVIVNNDNQQKLKKGKIIMSESERLYVIKAIRYVDEAMLSEELKDDPSITKTLENVAKKYGDMYSITFANGGDRDSSKEVPETSVCEKYNIAMIFDMGGNEKLNSSSNINRLTGAEPSTSPTQN